TLNTPITQLKQTIPNYDHQFHHPNYINPHKHKKHPYDNALNDAKQLINQSHANQPQLHPPQINKLTQTLNTTKNHLNPNHKFAEPKRHANTTIHPLTYLNQAQPNKPKQ
ncbi:FIVAR domain-containing protein, partial [Staphylococcus epidermidis]|uniref:FIVAR domain-containing protein n=1 Tax=Staphylococcus epidermidis TaxID=1282 RepID=UPI00119FCA04